MTDGAQGLEPGTAAVGVAFEPKVMFEPKVAFEPKEEGLEPSSWEAAPAAEVAPGDQPDGQDDDPAQLLSACPVLVPMAEWVKEDGPGCRPCGLAAVLPLYRDTLEAAGYEGLARQISALADRDVQPEEVGRLLDEVKAQVGESVRVRLRAWDCLAQSQIE